MSDEPQMELLRQVQQGDEQALARLFEQHHERLRRMVQFRMDNRLRGRSDPDDILQEAYLDAAQRASHLRVESEHAGFIWLRLIVNQTLINVHRRHLGAQMRDVNREQQRSAHSHAGSTADSMIVSLLGHMTSPTQATRRAELTIQLERSLAAMDPIDRQVLALRHFEEMSNAEVAQELDMQPKATSIRYVRALARLKDILVEIPGFQDSYGDGV